MKILIVILLIIVCIAPISSKNIREDYRNKIIKSYLKEVHSIEIPDSNFNYVIVQLDGCFSCFSSLLRSLEQPIKHLNNIFVILSYFSKNIPYIPIDPNKYDNVEMEYKHQFYALGLITGNSVLLQTKDGEIVNFYEIPSNKIDSAMIKIYDFR